MVEFCASLRYGVNYVTVMMLSCQTDTPGQQCRSRQDYLIRVFTVWNSVCIFTQYFSVVKFSCFNFRVITANVNGV